MEKKQTNKSLKCMMTSARKHPRHHSCSGSNPRSTLRRMHVPLMAESLQVQQGFIEVTVQVYQLKESKLHNPPCGLRSDELSERYSKDKTQLSADKPLSVRFFRCVATGGAGLLCVASQLLTFLEENSWRTERWFNCTNLVIHHVTVAWLYVSLLWVSLDEKWM